MQMTKEAYIAWLESQIVDIDPADLEQVFDELEAAYVEQELPPLLELIDAATEAQELEDDMEDRAFWASGQW